MNQQTTDKSASGAFSVIKNWASDLTMRFRAGGSQPTAEKPQDEWSELSAPRATAREELAPQLRDLVHLRKDKSQPLTVRTSDPRTRQLIRDINHIGDDKDPRGDISVRRVLRLDARESVDSKKMTRAVLKQQVEDIEAALKMGERVVVHLDAPAVAKEVRAELKRLLTTDDYKANDKLLVKVEGEKQEAVWDNLGKGFISREEKKQREKQADTQPSNKENADDDLDFDLVDDKKDNMDKVLREADRRLQERLRDLSTDTPPQKVHIKIKDMDSLLYAEKHLRRLKKIYGDLLDVSTSKELSAEYKELRKKRAGENKELPAVTPPPRPQTKQQPETAENPLAFLDSGSSEDVSQIQIDTSSARQKKAQEKPEKKKLKRKKPKPAGKNTRWRDKPTGEDLPFEALESASDTKSDQDMFVNLPDSGEPGDDDIAAFLQNMGEYEQEKDQRKK